MCLATHILLNLYAKEPWHGMKIYMKLASVGKAAVYRCGHLAVGAGWRVAATHMPPGFKSL